jgi:16S rRNA (guanine527-N7)-methyltransferase
MDVFLLLDFYVITMENAKEPLELITNYFSDFTPKQIDQFSRLGALYTEWNQKINVISRKDIEALYERHVLHSLSIAAQYTFVPGLEIIDIGTGGGFPGVPLAIFFPEVKFHLVDSIAKKLKVVEAVKNELGLDNLSYEHTRAEQIKGRKFDFVVSRAVAPLKELWSWGKPLIRNARPFEEYKNGLICLKGGDLTQEIADSQLRPYVTPIQTIFPEAFFAEKYILYVPV